MDLKKLGGLAFLAGVILCVVLAFVAWIAPSVVQGAAGLITLVLIILGIIVGVFNINEKQRMELLISVIAVSMIGPITVQQLATLIPAISVLITALFQNTVALAVPAALIIGLKQIWYIGMNKK
ncbi:MAG: hypothetical protein ACOX1V_03775 [Candidatus Iainarchaeum sp.]